jgi:hypothetical protein
MFGKWTKDIENTTGRQLFLDIYIFQISQQFICWLDRNVWLFLFQHDTYNIYSYIVRPLKNADSYNPLEMFFLRCRQYNCSFMSATYHFSLCNEFTGIKLSLKHTITTQLKLPVNISLQCVLKIAMVYINQCYGSHMTLSKGNTITNWIEFVIH